MLRRGAKVDRSGRSRMHSARDLIHSSSVERVRIRLNRWHRHKLLLMMVFHGVH